MRKCLFILALIITLNITGYTQDEMEISAREAFNMLKKESTYLIDVRSIAEYIFVGHPVSAYCIPYQFWNEKEQKLIHNSNFIDDIQSRFKESDVLIFICRSGSRSLRTALLVRDAGFDNVFSIDEGFEGKKDRRGLRTVNGWKNKLPYTYELNPDLIYR